MNSTVAIIGRPNVGKSTLFNRISGKRISIVDSKPGVTRDRIYADIDWCGRCFSLVDTGGIEIECSDIILEEILTQTQIAINTADLLLFVLDTRQGITIADREIAKELKKNKKNVIVVCNKADTFNTKLEIYEFYNLNLGEPIGISASNGLGVGDLLDRVSESLPSDSIKSITNAVKVAIVGKPNVGKSSLVNKILGDNRCIVSHIAGTTRDSIDQRFERNNKDYILIDTAGMRKRGRIDEAIERYSVNRALGAVDRADVCLIMLDATEGVTEQDTKIAGYVHDSGKPSVVLANKWDLLEETDINDFRLSVKEGLNYMMYAPVDCISVFSGYKIEGIFDVVDEVFEQSNKRITTGLLNQIISNAVTLTPPQSHKGKRLKIYFVTQASVVPPTFVLFVNSKDLVHFSYIRYLENRIRDAFGFVGTPIKFVIKEKTSKS